MIDLYIYLIVALLPLVAIILIVQVNPYYALVIRGVLGAIAALIYAILGAADVALTEALVGTMLAITLYLVAVRSSFVMRLGVLTELESQTASYFPELITKLKQVIKQYYLRLELIQYPDLKSLEAALKAKEVHAICTQQKTAKNNQQIYHTTVRVPRLFEIFQTKLNFAETSLSYVSVPTEEEQH